RPPHSGSSPPRTRRPLRSLATRLAKTANLYHSIGRQIGERVSRLPERETRKAAIACGQKRRSPCARCGELCARRSLLQKAGRQNPFGSYASSALLPAIMDSVG